MSNTIKIEFDISCVDMLKDKIAARRNRAQEILDLADGVILPFLIIS